MQNTSISMTEPAAGNVDPGMTSGTMGRMANFNEGVNGNKTTLTPPKVKQTDITSDIK